jgi:hypothetical protein
MEQGPLFWITSELSIVALKILAFVRPWHFFVPIATISKLDLTLYSWDIYSMVKEIHKTGVYHNDSEPRNGLAHEGGQVYMTDFHVVESAYECHMPETCDELRRLGRRLDISTL